MSDRKWQPDDEAIYHDPYSVYHRKRVWLIERRTNGGVSEWSFSLTYGGKPECFRWEERFRRPPGIVIPTLADRQAALAARQRELIEGYGEGWTVRPKVEAEMSKHEWRPGMRAVVDSLGDRDHGRRVMLRNCTHLEPEAWGWLVDGDDPGPRSFMKFELIPEPSPSPVRLDPREPVDVAVMAGSWVFDCAGGE